MLNICKFDLKPLSDFSLPAGYQILYLKVNIYGDTLYLESINGINSPTVEDLNLITGNSLLFHHSVLEKHRFKCQTLKIITYMNHVIYNKY